MDMHILRREELSKKIERYTKKLEQAIHCNEVLLLLTLLYNLSRTVGNIGVVLSFIL